MVEMKKLQKSYPSTKLTNLTKISTTKQKTCTLFSIYYVIYGKAANYFNRAYSNKLLTIKRFLEQLFSHRNRQMTRTQIFIEPFESHRWSNGQRVRLECGRSWVQTKDYKIGICCLSAKSAALRRKNKEGLARNQDNVTDGDDMSIRGLLFQ